MTPDGQTRKSPILVTTSMTSVSWISSENPVSQQLPSMPCHRFGRLHNISVPGEEATAHFATSPRPLSHCACSNDFPSFSLHFFAPPSPGYGRFDTQPGKEYHSTLTTIPSLCAANSGAYMHCIDEMPLEKRPACETRRGYSNTWTPFRRRWKKKLTDASFGAS